MSEEIKKIAWDAAVKIHAQQLGHLHVDLLGKYQGIVEAAVEEALRAVPVPSPVSDERLEYIRQNDEGCANAYAKDPAGERRELLQHVRFLTALVRDLSADGAVAQYRAGWEACMRSSLADSAAAKEAWGKDS